MFDLKAIQGALCEFGIDAWLLYDFRGLNVLARRILEIAPDAHTSRRFFYLIPAKGEPRKLVHRIETATLDHLPGEKDYYLKWQELEAAVRGLVAGKAKIAMEYSPRNANPYISRVDAGTVELVKSFGAEVVGSGDLIQQFEATWDSEQWAMHLEADRHNPIGLRRRLGPDRRPGPGREKGPRDRGPDGDHGPLPQEWDDDLPRPPSSASAPTAATRTTSP